MGCNVPGLNVYGLKWTGLEVNGVKSTGFISWGYLFWPQMALGWNVPRIKVHGMKRIVVKGPGVIRRWGEGQWVEIYPGLNVNRMKIIGVICSGLLRLRNELPMVWDVWWKKVHGLTSTGVNHPFGGKYCG